MKLKIESLGTIFTEHSGKSLEGVIPPLLIKYKNWKGIISIRKIIPDYVWYGTTDFHKDIQYLLHAWDVEKQAYRDFAIGEILEFIK